MSVTEVRPSQKTNRESAAIGTAPSGEKMPLEARDAPAGS
jgi:hypothetical protein